MKNRVFVWCFLVIGLLVLSGGAALAEEGEKGKAEAPAEDAGTYRIGAGDILQIVTWKEPDFTKEDVLVRIDGKISFPLLNDVQASGRTALELKGTIEEGLTDYVDSPEVTVTVRSPVSQRFYILGEVARTGEYPIVKNLTVLQAFAVAGGFTEWASKKEIILFRQVDGQEKIIRVNYKDIVKGRNMENNIPIKADDTIVVP